MEFCLSLVSLHIIIKTMKEDIRIMFIMLVKDIIKQEQLFQISWQPRKMDQILAKETLIDIYTVTHSHLKNICL